MGKPPRRTTQLLIMGLGLLVMGIAIGNRFKDQSAFGLSGDFYSGVLMGMAIGVLLLSVVEARKKA